MKKGQGKKLMIGLIAVFVLFQILGGALGSDRGQAGILIGLIVAAATLVTERLLFGDTLPGSAKNIGLRTPSAKGTTIAMVIGGIMLLGIPFFAAAMNAAFEPFPGWQWLAVGIFFQAGIAEETLFRGYLFGHLRQRQTFWNAAGLAAVPFVLVHLILFYSLPWMIGAASILLAVAMSFPLSRLFELDGDSVWAPAFIHFIAQAGVKLVVPSGEYAWLFPFFWMLVCAIVPLGVYAFPLIVRVSKKLVSAPAAVTAYSRGVSPGQIEENVPGPHRGRHPSDHKIL